MNLWIKMWHFLNDIFLVFNSLGCILDPTLLTSLFFWWPAEEFIQRGQQFALRCIFAIFRHFVDILKYLKDIFEFCLKFQTAF